MRGEELVGRRTEPTRKYKSDETPVSYGRDEARAGAAAEKASHSGGEVTASHFRIDLDRLVETYAAFRSGFPDAAIHYALKANSHPSVVAALHRAGCGFEAASWGEIELLLRVGVAPERVIYGTAVKPRWDTQSAFRAGVSRFAADAEAELRMLAEAAPRSSVFVRVRLPDAQSVFGLNGGKFGAPVGKAAELVQLARELGLSPEGLSFNVGSRATRAVEWANGIRAVAPVLTELLTRGIRLNSLNIGGGFPAPYDGEPSIALTDIRRAVDEATCELPYPIAIICEPGRALVAECATLVARVIRRVERPSGPWLFLDCGVYNALFEALACQGRTPYPVKLFGRGGALAPFVLAGPTGDDLDIVRESALLPEDADEGDLLQFENVGAYTLALASSFNGIPVPPVVIAGAQP